eukprot:2258963-Pleurochrysis_carterae.AAC.1
MEDPPRGARALCRGFQAQHFKRLAAAGLWRRTTRERLEWAAALLAHNLRQCAGGNAEGQGAPTHY